MQALKRARGRATWMPVDASGTCQLNLLGLTQLACCACGRAVRSFPIVYGFSALRAEKPYTQDRYVPCCRRQKRGIVTPKNATAYVLSLADAGAGGQSRPAPASEKR